MVHESEAKVKIVVGKRGSGKSYLVKSMLAAESRIVVYDTQREYVQGVTYEASEYGEMVSDWVSRAARPFRFVYRPADAMDLDEFDRLCELVYCCGSLLFVCEEVHTYCQTNRVTPHFRAILSRGRHKGVSVLGITQRPFGIDRYLTSQAKEAYLFSTHEPRDLKYIQDAFGYGAAQRVQALNQYEHVLWEEQGGISVAKAS